MDIIRISVRFLDSVVDANTHPTKATIDMNIRTRKIGLGVMGWADLLYQLEIPYQSKEALALVDTVGKILQETADTTSEILGKQLGAFKEFDQSPLNKKNGGKWISMRNAWRLSIAPTGTIAMIADTSSSIEPQFALAYTKKNLSASLEDEKFIYINKYFLMAIVNTQLTDSEKKEIINGLKNKESLQSMYYEAEGFDKLKKVFVVTEDVSPEEHVKVQAVFQKYVDSGISKTINLANEATEEDVSEAYSLAWKLGCKGITVYRAGSREKEVLVSGTSESESKSVVTESYVDDWVRPIDMSGVTSKIQTGHGSLYVTMNKDSSNQIKEVVAWTGKSGACEHAASEAFGRLISTAIQFGVPMPLIIKQLKGIECCPQFWNGKRVSSPPDGIAQILENTLGTAIEPVTTKTLTRFSSDTVDGKSFGVKRNTSKDLCKDCSTQLIEQSGCITCPSCGWSKCG